MSQQPPDLPARIGPYRIVGPLGRGGMGVVFRGEPSDGGPNVAIKTVRAPRASALQSIRREIHALAQLRHPGIVPIVGEGVEAGIPGYLMELLEGVTLRRFFTHGDSGNEDDGRQQPMTPPGPDPRDTGKPDSLVPAAKPDPTVTFRSVGVTLVEDPPSHPNALAQPLSTTLDTKLAALRRDVLLRRLRLFHRLCAPLGYLHGEGLVHRDLKPENILVLPNGMPVLMDFGIVTRFGGALAREELEVAGKISGTVAYMAPEQCRGELVDARADLYALGCILYETVVGRPPFVGHPAAQVLFQHCNERPTPPSELVEDVPAGLDALILRLLSKEPRHRLGHADDVAAALAKLSPGIEEDPPGPTARAYLYRPELTGREEVLDGLLGHLGRAAAGAGGMVLLSGESGVGKTRLAMALGREAEVRGFHVLAGECVPGVSRDESRGGNANGQAVDAPGRKWSVKASAQARGGTPLEPLRKPLQWIADRCREQGPEATRRLLGHRAGILDAIEPGFFGLAGLEPAPQLAELPPDAARQRLYGALADTLVAVSEESPVLLILDDLHWADELTVGFLEMLARGADLAQRRLFVFGMARMEEEGDVLQKLSKLPQVESIRLGRLDGTAVGAMVADMLALDTGPRTFVGFLTRHSEGNPFFVAEYLRTAVAEGVLFRDSNGRWMVRADDETATEQTYEGLPLPKALRDVVRRRLEGLPRRASELAEAAAVFGREVDATVLARSSGLEENELQEWIGVLMRREVLEESVDGGLRFVHDKIREVAYAGIESERRRELHASAATAVEERFGTGRYEHLVVLSRHWELAGREVVAARYRAEAGQQAAASYTAREGLAELDRAIPVLVGADPNPENRAALLSALDARCRILNQLGRFVDAEADARRLAELAQATGDQRFRGRGLREAGLARYNLGDYAKALAAYESSLEALGQIGDPDELCWTRVEVGWIHSSQGDYEAADSHFLAALATPGLSDGSSSRLNCMMKRAMTLVQRGRVSEALSIYEGLLSEYDARGDIYSHALCKASLGLVHRDLGDTDRALRLLEEATEVFARLQAVQYYLLHSYNAGLILADRGEFARAAKTFEETRRTARGHGEVLLASVASVSLASCELPRGRISSAARLAASAVRSFARLGNRLWLSTALLWEGASHAAAGRSDVSDERFLRALEISRSLDTPLETWKVCFHWAHAALERSGPTDWSRALALEALDAASRRQSKAHMLLASVLLDLHNGEWNDYLSKLTDLQGMQVSRRFLQRSVLAGADAALRAGLTEQAVEVMKLYRQLVNPEHRLHERRASRIEHALLAKPIAARRRHRGSHPTFGIPKR